MQTVLVAAAVGGTFLAGLVLHGVVGGVLLLLVAAALGSLTVGVWHRTRPEGRPLRVLILAAVVGLAALKLTGRL